MKRISSVGFMGLVGIFALGCASAPAAPFDTLKTANVTIFRLQNFEPPVAAAAPSAAQPGIIPGIPQEITQWAQQALPGLQQFLPPGLLPPGLLGGATPPAAAPAAPDAPRFPMSQPNFRILGSSQVIDPDLKAQLGKLLGNPDSFQADHANCMYAEMGLSFMSGNQLNDMLVSFSCNQADARSFAWPHANHGLKPETVKELDQIVQKIWPT